MGVSLCGRRSLGGERRAQIPETRHGDYFETVLSERLAEFQSLIVAAARAMNE
jgi:hypothetical protein